MPQPSLQQLVAHVRGLAQTAPSDCELLERFLAFRDESAFAAIVHRHGPMVLATCRRLLSHEHDSEDAWQAAFLVLACRASAIRNRHNLAGWLHGVACRTARKLRADIARRRLSNESLPDLPARDGLPDLGWREVQAILDEELERLPQRYREPIVLCYLEGLTRDEAAQRLGWTFDAVRGRLERGRQRLRRQLTRRGVALPAALVGSALAGQTRAEVPALLASAAVRVAKQLGEGFAPANVVPGKIANLMEGVIQAMCWTRAKLSAVMILGACLAMLTAGLVAQPPKAGAPDRGAPMGKDLADLDGDGRPDILLAHPPPRRHAPLDCYLFGNCKACHAAQPDTRPAAPAGLEKRVAELEKQVAHLTREVEKLNRTRGKLDLQPEEIVENVVLKFTKGKEVARIIRDLMEPGSGFSVAVDEKSNSLILRGSRADLAKVREIIIRIDSGGPAVGTGDSILKTFTLETVKAEALVKIFEQMFRDTPLRVAAVGGKKIMVYGTPEMMKDVEAVIRKLERLQEEEREAELKRQQQQRDEERKRLMR